MAASLPNNTTMSGFLCLVRISCMDSCQADMLFSERQFISSKMGIKDVSSRPASRTKDNNSSCTYRFSEPKELIHRIFLISPSSSNACDGREKNNTSNRLIMWVKYNDFVFTVYLYASKFDAKISIKTTSDTFFP